MNIVLTLYLSLYELWLDGIRLAVISLHINTVYWY